jgi:UDP-3-O-[3-hydroxymyristoyl] N-acetylglucosamine deacetylase
LDQIAFHGPGLHSGEICGVTLTRAPGPVCFVHEEAELIRERLQVLRADHGVRVSLGGSREVDLVEHLFAAFGGLGVQSGVRIEARGPEIPILDGAAAELGCALRALDAPRGRPALEVVQAGEVIVGRSRYSFEPKEAIEVGVEVEFPVVGRQRAHWSGNARDFIERIARARTFGFRSSSRELELHGRARFVDPRTVIVLEDDGSVLPPGTPPAPTELADHKLLDLLGDLWLFGGPPIGRVFAWRPGHRATHQAVKQGLSYGLLARTGQGTSAE